MRGGVLRVAGGAVHVAAREAHVRDDLAALPEGIRQARESRNWRSDRSTRSLYQMQIGAWRRLMEYEDERAR